MTDPIENSGQSTDEVLAAEELKANEAAAQATEDSDGESVSANEATTTEDEGAAETGEQSTEDESTSTETESVNEDSKLSARGQKRTRDLAAENQELKDQIARLSSRTQPERRVAPSWLTGETPKTPATPGKLPWDQDSDTEQNDKVLTEDELNEKVNSQVTQKLEIERKVNLLNDDIFQVEETYPEFKEELAPGQPNPEFNADLVKKVTGWYEAAFKQDNTLRFKDFVNDLMALRNQGREEGKKQVDATVAKQAAEQAIDPSGTPETSNSTQDLEERIRTAKTSKELAELEKSLPHAE